MSPLTAPRRTRVRAAEPVERTANADSWDTLSAQVDRLNRTDPREALQVAESWLARERERDHGEGYARALRSHAHTLRFLGMYEMAINQYEEAEHCFDGLELQSEAARTRIGHVVALKFLGRYDEAVQLAEQTRAYFLDHGDELQAAKQALNLGTIYRPMGRLQAALKAYQEARGVFRRLGERSLLADVEQNIGNVLKDLGKYDRAITRLHTAERIRRSLGLQSEVARTLMNVGALYDRRGEYGRAIQAFAEARRIYEQLGVERETAVVDLASLPALIALNLRAESLATAERVIERLRAHNMPLELGQSLLAAAGLAESEGDWQLAQQRAEEARQLFMRNGNSLWESIAMLQVCRLGLHDDKETTLRSALRACQQAVEQLEAAGALDRAIYGNLVEGALLVRLGASEAALRCFSQVLDAAGALKAAHLLYQAHASIAELLEPDAPEAAVSSYRIAIDYLETVRARTLADDLKLSFLADKADLYERLVGLLIQRGAETDVTEAYSYVERAKSRALLEELLIGAGDAHTARRRTRLERQARDLRARLNDAYNQAYGAEDVPTSDCVSQSDHAETIDRLEKELAATMRQLQLAERTERPGLFVTGQTGQDALSVDTALVEFYGLNGDLVAFVKSRQGLVFQRLVPLAKIETLVERLAFQMGNGSFGTEYLLANLERERRGVNNCLRSLWSAIVEPLTPFIQDTRQLVVVPHGPLHSLPFHAFFDGERYVAEIWRVSYAPSAAVYFACMHAARPLRERAVVVGIEDPNLPWVAREVETVARAWPDSTVLAGRRATTRALRRLAGEFDTLHLATHAVFRADNPMYSSIKLADGWLTARDLGEIVRGAQLVTLSACETGLAGLGGGDEILGLTRGILAAGCSTAVASLWPVADETTAMLMNRFYAGLRDGVDPTEALRAAMLDLRAQYDHPYFWAPFAVIGGGQARAQREPRDTRE